MAPGLGPTRKTKPTRNAWAFVTRIWVGLVAETSGDSDLVATLCTATVEYRCACFGLHAGQKAMRLGTVAAVGLESTLRHENYSWAPRATVALGSDLECVSKRVLLALRLFPWKGFRQRVSVEKNSSRLPNCTRQRLVGEGFPHFACEGCRARYPRFCSSGYSKRSRWSVPLPAIQAEKTPTFTGLGATYPFALYQSGLPSFPVLPSNPFTKSGRGGPYTISSLPPLTNHRDPSRIPAQSQAKSSALSIGKPTPLPGGP